MGSGTPLSRVRNYFTRLLHGKSSTAGQLEGVKATLSDGTLTFSVSRTLDVRRIYLDVPLSNLETITLNSFVRKSPLP